MDSTYIGYHKLVQAAADAYDFFTEDELEIAADEHRANEAAKGDVE